MTRCLLSCLLFLFFSSLPAQQTTSAKDPQNIEQFLRVWRSDKSQDPRQSPMYLKPGAMELRETTDGIYQWVASEGVHIWQGKEDNPLLELMCQEAVVWIKPAATPGISKAHKPIADNKSRLAAIQEKLEVARLYAEGSVMLRWGNNILYGERLFFDLLRNRGVILHSSLRGSTDYEKRKLPLHVRAQEIWIHSEYDFLAIEAAVSTCQFGSPHYQFGAREIHVVRDDKAATIQGYDNVLYGAGIPLFYFPYLGWSTDQEWPIQSFHAGRSSRFGYFVETTWRGTLYQRGKGEDFPLDKLRWLLDVDVRQERGIGLGPQLVYKGSWPEKSSFNGHIRGYFVRDQPLNELGTGLQSGPSEDDEARWQNRHRFYLLHRHEFPGRLTLDTEISQISDRHLLTDFFEEDARETKEQETYLYGKKLWENHAASLLLRYSINDFQTQTAYLPQFTYYIMHEPLAAEWGGPWYFSSRLETSYVRRQDDTENPTAFFGEKNFRVDWQNTLSRKWSVGPFFVTPFATSRLSYFANGREEDHLLRRSGEFGIDVATNFYRLYSVDSELFAIHNLLHVMTPGVRYAWLYANTESPGHLIPFDTMETVDKVQKIDFRLTNRFKTVRNGNIVQFLFLEAELSCFPERDIEGIVGVAAKLDPLKLDWQWQISHSLSWYARAEYDFAVRDWSKAVARLTWNLMPDWQFVLDSRYQRKIELITTATVSYYPSHKWGLHLSTQYEFTENFSDHRLREIRFTLQRRLHDFVLDIQVRRDIVDSNTSLVANFYPLDLMKTGFSRQNELEQEPPSNSDTFLAR